MLTVPSDLQLKFDEHLRKSGIPLNACGACKKWLRYYLDYCNKYQKPPEQEKSLSFFIGKLQEKGQTESQIRQAVTSVTLYYTLLKDRGGAFGTPVPRTIGPATASPINNWAGQNPGIGQPSQADHPRPGDRHAAPSAEIASDHRGQHDFLGKVSPPRQAALARGHSAQPQTGASWVAEYSRLENEIRIRHYSLKTLKTYQGWLKQLQAFTRSKSAHLLSTEDVKEFLTFLAVKRKVSATTQNQAFNALLFFFRHVLGREFGKVDGVVRAKRKPYIPVVLSREEIDAVLKHLPYPYDLVVKMLYGCGLRLFECLNLRVHCMNFDAGIVRCMTARDRKTGRCLFLGRSFPN